MVVLTSHELSHFTRTWFGERRYSIINVCETLPRNIHLMKQQAQGVEITDLAEIELLRLKKSKKRDDSGDDNDKGEKDEEGLSRIDVLNLPGELQEQDKQSNRRWGIYLQKAEPSYGQT